MAQGRILAVDDEEDLREILEFNLRGEGYDVTAVGSAEQALELSIPLYDLILLDIMMGGMSGLHFAEKLRQEMNIDVPIIFLTARDSENDLLTGFNIGADDYIKKPFSIKELLVRIRAVLSRTREADDPEFVLDRGGCAWMSGTRLLPSMAS